MERDENSRSNRLVEHLKRNKIATLEQLKEELKTNSTMTVFRKLKKMDYLTSYSHRGKYYTLNSVAEFDEIGLWSFSSIWFSKYGNLIETALEFVEESKAGFSNDQLSRILHVEAKHALLQLHKENRLYREKTGGRLVYYSIEPKKRKRQTVLRKSGDLAVALDTNYEIDVYRDELKAAIILFHSLLDERQRRFYAGLESFKLGHGGDSKIAELLGMDPHTVAKGRRELLSGNLRADRIRKEGGGRKSTEKKSRK